jgi:hypothetical protein
MGRRYENRGRGTGKRLESVEEGGKEKEEELEKERAMEERRRRWRRRRRRRRKRTNEIKPYFLLISIPALFRQALL